MAVSIVMFTLSLHYIYNENQKISYGLIERWAPTFAAHWWKTTDSWSWQLKDSTLIKNSVTAIALGCFARGFACTRATQFGAMISDGAYWSDFHLIIGQNEMSIINAWSCSKQSTIKWRRVQMQLIFFDSYCRKGDIDNFNGRPLLV